MSENLLLVVAGYNLAECHKGVGIHDGNPAKAFGLFEGGEEEGFLGCEGDFGGVGGLDVGGGLNLHVAGGLLALLPRDGGHLAGGLGGHVGFLGEALDVHADVVTAFGGGEDLVVLLDGEDLDLAIVLLGHALGDEGDEVAGLEAALLDAASEDITDTTDLEAAGKRHVKALALGTLRGLDVVVEGVLEGHASDLVLLGEVALPSLEPGGSRVLGGGDEVVTGPAREGDERNALDGVANGLEHLAHFALDLLVTVLVPLAVIHLVDTDDHLGDAELEKKEGVLTGLAGDFTSGAVALLDSGLETSLVGGNHEKGDIGLGSAGKHVLHEITMAGGINDSVVVVVSEELLGGARDGDTTLTLLLLLVHVEGEGERTLVENLGFLLELLHFTLGDTTEGEEKVAGGGRLAGVDMAGDDNGDMGFDGHGERYKGK